MKRMWQAFRGRERLTLVFWGFYVMGGLVAVILPFVVAEPLYDLGLPLWSFTLIAVVQSLYLLWAHISLWACAFNSSRRVWGYLTRGYVCVVAALFVVSMFRPFVHTGEIEVRKISSAEPATESSCCGRSRVKRAPGERYG